MQLEFVNQLRIFNSTNILQLEVTISDESDWQARSNSNHQSRSRNPTSVAVFVSVINVRAFPLGPAADMYIIAKKTGY